MNDYLLRAWFAPTRAALSVVICSLLLGAAPMQDPTPKDAANDRDAAAATALAQSMPRTRALLDHLREANPQLHAQLLEHARTLAPRAEDEAFAFARENHPELAQMLSELERRGHRGFRIALRELMQDAGRLRELRERSPEQYEPALEAWRAESRLRFYAAQLMARRRAAPDEFDPRSELRALATRAIQTQRDQTAARVARLREQADRLEQRITEPLDATVERELESIRKRFDKHRRPR